MRWWRGLAASVWLAFVLAGPSLSAPFPPRVPSASLFDGSGPPASQARLISVRGDAPPAAAVRVSVWSPAFRTAQGSELLEYAHYLAKRGHETLSYDSARYHMFSEVDNVRADGVPGVVAMYSWVFVPGTSGRGGDYRERGDQNEDGYVDSSGMNAEHVWPQSYFKKRLPMRSDLHNLLPTFMHPNSVRGRLPFAEVPYYDADYANSAGALRGSAGFEPPDASKGRVARAMFYFFARYLGTYIIPRDAAGSFWNSRIELLLRWNREFPPDDLEIYRNGRIEAAQGNRNPFIDDPTLADRIGADGFRMPASKGAYAARPLRL